MTEKYTPSPTLLSALEELDAARERVQQLQRAVYDAVADDLRANPELTNADVAGHEKIPYTQETVRKIAREYDIPRKRKPTVRAIKPKKRAAGRVDG
ncbi:hypothetical protein [Streptomyces sp. 2P-4]|uniref:hypothetical protein n=1 Tax=Streptomyces sp. 2P-4 TaxID=2931974 RepID=UPI00253FA33B|nr:hypothetical protein [Streptomyces sp. 2P-4]